MVRCRWAGMGGGATPMHFDAMSNFFTQLVGRKQVLVVPALPQPLPRPLQQPLSQPLSTALSRGRVWSAWCTGARFSAVAELPPLPPRMLPPDGLVREGLRRPLHGRLHGPASTARHPRHVSWQVRDGRRRAARAGDAPGATARAWPGGDARGWRRALAALLLLAPRETTRRGPAQLEPQLLVRRAARRPHPPLSLLS